MRDYGTMTNPTAKGCKHIQMDQDTKEYLTKELNNAIQEDILGATEKYTKDLSEMDTWKEKENYTWLTEKACILDNFQEI